MDFTLSEEHKMLQATMRQFATEKLAPIADKVDEEDEFPMDNFKMMADLGLYGLIVSPEYGGSGSDALSFVIASEEIAKACASSSNILNSQVALIRQIFWDGTEEQKRKFIPPLIKGELIGATAITEPEAGSDVKHIKTTAVKDGNTYILNGTKAMITHAPVCDVVSVVTNMPALGEHGKTIFLVEKDTPGFIRGKKYRKLGMRGAPAGELIFEDCRIPETNRLGKEGEGFRNIIKSLNRGARLNLAARGLGITQAILEKCIEYSNQRVQFDRPIGSNEAVAWMLADMATELDAARLLTYRAALAADQGVSGYVQSQAKLYATELCMKAAVQGIQIFGSYGYMMDSPMQRYFRDAKATTIADGTSEIQRLIIARGIGLPIK